MNSPVFNALARKPAAGTKLPKPALAFAVCLVVGIAVTWWSAVTRVDRARAAARADARARIAAIELGFSGAFRAAEVIGLSVRQGNGRPLDFQRSAAELLSHHSALATIELQPGGVTTEIAPRAGNERALGHNLMTDPLGREAVLTSLQRRSLSVAGPVVLADGQLGLLARQPVFLGGSPGREQPWGFVTAAVRFREVILDARLDELTPLGYQFSLFATAAPLQPAGTITSTFRGVPADALVQPLRLANLELKLALRPTGGWLNKWAIALNSLVALCLAAAVGGAVRWWETAKAASASVSQADLRAARDRDRFRALFDALPEAAVLVDRQGAIQRVNEAAERLFAGRQSDLAGKTINALVPGLAALLNSASRSLSQPAIQLTGVRSNTAEFPAEIRLSPLTAVESGPAICCLIREAPLSPKTQTEVQDPLVLTQALLDAIPHPVFIKDAQARFVICNRAYQTTFGLSAESLRGKTVLDLDDLPPETRRTFYAEDLALIAEAGFRSYELPIVRADGSARTVTYSVGGYRLADGGPGGLMGILTDITPQKEAEQDLRRQRAELDRTRLLSETVMELTGFASWRVPLDGSAWFDSSPPAVALMGDPPQPENRYRLREDWFANARAGDEPAAQRTIEQLHLVAEGRLPKFDAIYAYRRPRDGQVVWLHATGRRVEDAAGRPSEIFGVVSDLTALKRLESEVAAARADARQAALALAAALAASDSKVINLTEAVPSAVETTGDKRLTDPTEPSAQPLSPAVENAAPAAASDSPDGGVVARSENLATAAESVAKVSDTDPPIPQPETESTTVPGDAGLREPYQEKPASVPVPVFEPIVVQGQSASSTEIGAEIPHESPALLVGNRPAGLPVEPKNPRPSKRASAGQEMPPAEGESLPIEKRQLPAVPDSPAELPPRSAKLARRRRVQRDEQLSLFGGDTPGSASEDADTLTQAVPTAVTSDVVLPISAAVEAVLATEVPPVAEVEIAGPAESQGNGARMASTAEDPPPRAVPPVESASGNDEAQSPVDPAEPSPPADVSKAEAALAEAVSDFLAVEGLDSTVGLHRVRGNQKQYLRGLRQFVDQHAHTTDEIRDLLMQGDSVGAERVANHLRSTAEELGATGVAEATASLERVIRDVGDPAEIEVRWGEAERALADLVRDLKPRVKSRGERAAARDEPPPEFNPADWRRVANQMLPLLADADPGAADCLAANRDVFRSAFAAESFAQFEQQVRESEFSSALELLKKTARKRNVSLH